MLFRESLQSLAKREISPRLATLWLAAVFVFAWAAADFLIFHPGCATDELGVIHAIQRFRDQHFLPWSLGRSPFSILLSSLFAYFGLGGLHLMMLASFALEICLLWALTKSWFGEDAAFYACLVALLSAFSLLRFRSLLFFNFLPAAFLLLLLWGGKLQRPGRAILWGLMAGLLCFEYEAWLTALPALLFFLWSEKKGRSILGQSLLGMAAGFGIVVLLSGSKLRGLLAVRRVQNYSPGAGSFLWHLFYNLKRYWLGGPMLPFLGVDGHAVFPSWALPGLLVGLALCIYRKPALLAWALLGSAPLFVGSSGSEPNRSIVAWPAFCMAAGAGFGFIWERGKFNASRVKKGALAAWVVLGFCWEASAYASNMGRFYASAWGESVQIRQAAEATQAALGGRQVQVLGRLNPLWEANFRFFLKAAPGQAVPVALIPGNYGEPAADWGLWRRFQAGREVPLFVVLPSKQFLQRIQVVSDELEIFRDPALDNPFVAKESCLRYLHQHPACDPFVRSVLWQSAVWGMLSTADLNTDSLQELAKADLASPDAWLSVADALRSAPRISLPFAQKACALNPHLKQGWMLQLQALEKLGQADKLEQLKAALAQKPADYYWDL